MLPRRLHARFRTFILGQLALLIVGGTYWYLHPKGTLVSYLAEHRSSLADLTFRVLTYVGDGWSIPLACLLVAFIRLRYALTLALIGLTQLGVTALLKREVFGNLPRPLAWFGEVPPEWLVAGVTTHTRYAFPSGHTITAFGLCFFLAMTVLPRGGTVGMLLLAALAAFSRVYLFQHFLEDVLVGSLVGTAIAAVWVLLLAGQGAPVLERRLVVGVR